MSNAYIAAIETATPKHCLDQKMIAKAMANGLGLNPIKALKLKKIYANSAIDSRYTVIEGFVDPTETRFFSEVDFPKMRERNELYKSHAPILALEAAKKALEGKDPKKLTHVISISCTGVFAPGLEFSLIKELGLDRGIDRLGINMMGCFGAFRGLAMAKALALQNPNHQVLVVCTELCTLHFQRTHDWDSLIANTLFADGAAAVIVDSNPEGALFKIESHRSLAIPDTFDEMQWEASDEGLLMKLSAKVPGCLSKHLTEFVTSLLGHQATIAGCDWPIHPGGKAILDTIEKILSLTKDQTRAAWDVLAKYGNMSSATFLFTLKRLLQEPSSTRKPWAIGLGFGPGLSIEGILLKNCGLTCETPIA